eukprot:gene12397-14646_t
MTSMALLTGLVVGIFMNGMIAVTFNDVKANSSYGWVWSLSYSRWAGELLLVAELEAAYEDQYQLLLIETENSKNGIVDDDRLAAVRIEEDRPNVSDISLST